MIKTRETQPECKTRETLTTTDADGYIGSDFGHVEKRGGVTIPPHFMTYNRICMKSITTGATSEAANATGK
jgi:hypothetical protein